jgi:hypothetical protein
LSSLKYITATRRRKALVVKLRVGGAFFIDKGTTEFWMEEKKLGLGLAYTLEQEALALGGNLKKAKDLRDAVEAKARARKSFAFPLDH